MNEPSLLELDAVNAVEKLTQRWSEVLSPRESGSGSYRPVDHRPLLVMLEDAKVSSLGGTTSGRSADSERTILNLQAFQLCAHIEGRVRGRLAELSRARFGETLCDAVRRLHDTARALHASHQLSSDEYERILRWFPKWVKQIWSLFDPPTVKHLVGSCPNLECGAVTVTVDGAPSSALVAYYWRGIRPEAKCQACGELWSGERELLTLGFHLGANMDVDALREMGVMN